MCFYGVMLFCFVSYIEDDVELKVGEVGINERRTENFFSVLFEPNKKIQVKPPFH